LKVVVTGGAGFIGSNFVRMWASGAFSEIQEVIVVDKLTYAGNMENLSTVMANKHFTFVKGDICSPELIEQVISTYNPVGFINFAAESHVDRSILGARDFVDTNIFGVQVVLDALKSRQEIRFLQVSTDEVYGSITEGSWTEESPLLPNSPYSATKASAELLCRAYFVTYGLDVVVTRSSNNYGPHHYPEKLIPLAITNLIQNLKVPVYGNGLNVRDWLHVDDHCRGIYLAFMNGKSGESYNIGGGTELTNLELVQNLLNSFQKTEEMIAWVEDRKGHDLRYSIDYTKAKSEIRYSPEKKFQFGLEETIFWYRNNETWWRPLLKK
jgi:dTDP-glucose 4,6-dehydratase